jgi:four helix bundle protein
LGESVLKEKSYDFALRIVNLNKYLQLHKEFVLSKQVLRSGTAIGAMVSEAKFAQSKADFVNKLSIALKEANETSYWLELLKDSKYIDKKMYNSIIKDNVKTTKNSLKGK